jgi:membrane-bound lytic murein transglycosylase MltF
MSAGCTAEKSVLNLIRERGELRVATRNGPTTYYLDREGETGLDYELGKALAKRLNVRLRIVTGRDESEIVRLVSAGQADIAAGGLRRKFVQASHLLPGPDYQQVTIQTVFGIGRQAPESFADIFPEQLHLLPSSLPADVLADLQVRYPKQSFYIHQDLTQTELLDMAEHGRVAFTVLPSNEIHHVRHLHPGLRAGPPVSGPESLAWGMARTGDTSLATEVEAFFRDVIPSGRLAELLAHFDAPVESFDYVDSLAFLDRVRERLPLHRESFVRAGVEANLDWRFIAAIGYQESHWEPAARSPTGVRGMMMLTVETARRLGVGNRLDAGQSIRGGTRYFLELRDRLPARINEPDRTWMALAAYNVGLGHLEDARVLTERNGRDPDDWLHVRDHLPLLSDEQWYRQTRHGYARGWEPVHYVRNIRRYYHVLLQLTQPEPSPQQLLVEAPALDLPLL